MPNSGSASEPDPPPRRSSRLIIVVGKGGAGRSTVAAGLAVEAADRGLSVLAIDSTDDGGLLGALSTSSRWSAVRGSIEVLGLSTEAALDQYLRIHLRFPVSPSRLGPLARIFDYVAAAAPGVREILVLGKIGWELKEGPWDLIVVDGPATGHAVEMVAAADNLGELIGVGPLTDQTAWVGDLIADPARTQSVVVTTPEELPISETLELIERLDHETRIGVGCVFINRVPPTVGASAEVDRLVGSKGLLGQVVSVAVDRSQVSEVQIERLAATRLPLIRVGECHDSVDAVGEAVRRIDHPDLLGVEV